ncbi:MAG: flagellar hook-associated protein FlgK [Oscillospiraceae bacterium]
MASSFMGLYVQREALVNAQKALDITGNNISNINTEGYSRQRVDVCSVANTGYNLLYNTSTSMAGQGVDSVGVTQLRDVLLDEKVRRYTTSANNYHVKDDVMSDVETALDNIEAEESGLATNLSKLKEALQSFTADNANRGEIANVVMQSARSVTEQIRYLDNRLTEISERTLGDANSTVSAINTLLENMGNLNEEITTSYVQMGYISSSTGNYKVQEEYGPLELKDKMNVYLDKLAEYGDVSYEAQNDGSFTVYFAGQIVVHREKYAQMAMTEVNPEPFDMGFAVTSAGTYDKATDTYSNLKDSDEWYDIRVANGDSIENYVRDQIALGGTVDISGTEYIRGGTLRGYLDTYNGDGIYAQDGGNTYQGIEYYRDMLNSFAKTVTEELNNIFADFGFEILTYENANGVSDFRTAAQNFKLTDTWINDPGIIAHPEDPDNDLEELDNTWIHKMLAAFSDNHKYGYTDASGKDHYDPNELGFEAFIAHISDNLGTQVEGNTKLMETTDIMLDSVTDARDEVMAVSINEEGINMLNYQKWYNAIARVVTTLDEALDKVINGMGRVGL